jgi:hypothetical protein
MSDTMGGLAATDEYDPNAVDWSRMNQPFGILKDTNPIEYGTASPLVNIRTQDIADATDKAMAFSGGGLGIKAYHSSPHDFDKFDLAKIGSGEGAQVYGHGLYFAENPAVSGQGGQYWQQFANRFGTAENSAAQHLAQAGFDREKAAQTLRDMIANPNESLSPHNLKTVQNIRQEAVKLLEGDKPVGPRTYEVNINADPAHFLDWDKPNSQQHAIVKDALAKLGLSKEEALAKAVDHPETVRQLSELGVPGAKYLDQGSRGAGQGSSNYVLFNDKLIDIMRKYAVPGAIGAGGMGALAAQDQYSNGGL